MKTGEPLIDNNYARNQNNRIVTSVIEPYNTPPKTGLKLARECLKLGHNYIQK